MGLDVRGIPVWNDNYAWLLRDEESGRCAVVDAPEAEPVLAVLAAEGWALDHILNTHHHPDHIGGNLALKAETGCTIIGPRADRARIPGIDRAVGEGDTVALGQSVAEVWDTPAHTRGHISFVFDGAAFVGDTLFVAGCGRLFEGTPAQMWTAMQRYASLPDDTLLYCAHEYTLSNLRFARHLEPDNPDLAAAEAAARRTRAVGDFTVPTTVGAERRTNPFMRADTAAVGAAVGLAAASPAEVLGEVRRLKNGFRG
jgi:hydroxyacylglutathione hydrolase